MEKKRSKLADAIDKEYKLKQAFKCSKCPNFNNDRCIEKECKRK